MHALESVTWRCERWTAPRDPNLFWAARRRLWAWRCGRSSGWLKPHLPVFFFHRLASSVTRAYTASLCGVEAFGKYRHAGQGRVGQTADRVEG